MTFTVGRGDLAQARVALEDVREALGYQEVLTDTAVAKISVVGIGMRSHAGVAARMFKALSERNINIQVISTSEIKVSVLVAAEYKALAGRALHTCFGLDGDEPPASGEGQ
jgi:aspartate kinase